MKAWPVIALMIALGFAGVPRSVAQTTEQKEAAPKYDVANETKIKGVIDEVKDRNCPVSGTLGAHLMIKAENKIYEVHVAPTKFVKSYEVVFQKGGRSRN